MRSLCLEKRHFRKKPIRPMALILRRPSDLSEDLAVVGRCEWQATCSSQGLDNMCTTMSDEEAVQRVRAGDWDSYGVLASRHRQRLHRLAQRFVRDPSDAEDAVQNAHLLALTHFDQYEERSAYVHWMTSITVNQLRTSYRRDRASARCELRDCHAAPTPSPEQLAIDNDIQRIVNCALERIPSEYSSVFRMRELAGFSTAETSHRLGITDACVKVRLFRARSMLRREIGTQLGRRAVRQSPREPVTFPASGGYVSRPTDSLDTIT